MEKRRKLATNLTLALIGTVVGLIISLAGVEIYFRIAGAPFHPDVLREQSLQYERANMARHVLPLREQEVQTGPMRYRVSQRGYRGPSFSTEAPDGVTRIAVIGGSAVFDIFADEGTDWPTRAQRMLEERDFDVQILNLGVPGHASWDGLGRFFGEAWMFQPHLVALSNCWNDLKYFTWLEPDSTVLRSRVPGPTPESENPYLSPVNSLDGLLLGSLAYAWIRWMILEQTVPVDVEGAVGSASPPAESFSPWARRQYELTLALFVQAVRETGGKPLLVTQARLPVEGNEGPVSSRIRYEYVGLTHQALVDAFDTCDRSMRRVARAHDVPILDLSHLNGVDSLFADHVHLRAAGSRIVADQFARFLASELAAELPSDRTPTDPLLERPGPPDR